MASEYDDVTMSEGQMLAVVRLLNQLREPDTALVVSIPSRDYHALMSIKTLLEASLDEISIVAEKRAARRQALVDAGHH